MWYRPRFSLRFLLIGIAILAMICGAWLRPRLQQLREIEQLKDRYVNVYVARPAWVPASMPYGDLLGTPVHAHVLIQSRSDGHFFLLGERMNLAEADAALQKLRRELRTKFGLNFLLAEVPSNPHMYNREFRQLSLQWQSTPCGLWLFSHCNQPVQLQPSAP